VLVSVTDFNYRNYLPRDNLPNKGYENVNK